MSVNVDAKIYTHHVGARGFAAPFGCPPRFDADIVQVLYEADAECAEQMRASDDKKDRYVFPFCIGGENRRGQLNVTVNPCPRLRLLISFRWILRGAKAISFGARKKRLSAESSR